MQQLAASSGPAAADAGQHFDAVFLKQVPAQQVSVIFAQLRVEGPYAVKGFSESGTAPRPRRR